MGLLSKFKRQDDASSAAPATAPDAVVVARTRARRRLIGATVLLGLGIVGFPLLFETQPRPIPVDIPIDIPRKESAPALTLPPARPASAAVVAPLDPPPDAAPDNATADAARAAKPAPTPAPAVVAPVPAVVAAAPPASRAEPASKPTPKPAEKPAEKPVAKAEAPKPAAASGDRAQALLDGKPKQEAPTADSARVVVQVGAYTDADKLREARHKVEKLGMKTYTQVVESDNGRRTRVRVGPFANRAEAEKAAARIKATGLPAAILSL
jgi:DedD protein